jgi:hypothetical protein
VLGLIAIDFNAICRHCTYLLDRCSAGDTQGQALTQDVEQMLNYVMDKVDHYLDKFEL